MKIFLTFFLTCILFSQNFFSKSDETMKTASEYVQAYSAKDFDKMATFYSDSSLFADYTAMDAFRNDNRRRGASIAPSLKKVFQNIPSFRIDVDNKFASGKFALFEGFVIYDYKTRNGNVSLNHRLIIIIEVGNGKVLKHLDYADYLTMNKQFAPSKKLDTSTFTTKTAMDFRIGTWAWEAEALTPQGKLAKGLGTSNSRYINNGKAILDETKIVYDGSYVYEAISYRTYDAKKDKWMIVWAQANSSQSLQIEGFWEKDRFVELNFGTDEKGDWVNRLEMTEITEHSHKGVLTRTYKGKEALVQFSYKATKISD